MMNAGLQNTILSSYGSTRTQEWRSGDPTDNDKIILLEMIICSVFVDGLSRSGSDKVYNTRGPVYE